MKKEYTDKQIFEELPIYKSIAIMAVPTIISQLIHVVYNLSDTYFVGMTKDPSAVAAISLILPIYNMMTGLANLFGIGGAATIARAIGNNDYQKARKTFSLSFYSALFISSIYAILIFIFGRSILLLIGGDASDIDYAVMYSIITIVIGGIPTIVSASLASLIRSTGASKQAGFGLTLGAILNIVLDPLFMFVILPKGNEVMGAAIATTLSNIVSLIYFLTYIIKHKENAIYNFELPIINKIKTLLNEIVKSGLPSFFQLGAAMFSNCFLNNMISTYGSAKAIAGLGVTRKIDSVAYSYIQGVTQGILPIISYCYASKKYERMKKVILSGSILVFSFSLISCITCLSFAPSFIAFFINEEATIFFGAKFLRILTVSIPIYSITFIIIAVFQAIGEFKKPFYLTIIRKGSLDVIGFFTIRYFFGLDKILYASPLTEIVCVTIALIWLFNMFKDVSEKEIVHV